VAWRGEGDQQLPTRLQFWAGQPTVQELAVRKNSGPWVVLGSGLQREFHVTSGKQRMSQVKATQFKLLSIEVTEEVYEREKWNTFGMRP
jgi:hypothetical protein